MSLEIIKHPPAGTIPSLVGDNVFTDGIYRYTERPDGTWYRLTIGDWLRDGLPDQLGVELYKLIDSGMEPYLVFEIVAL